MIFPLTMLILTSLPLFSYWYCNGDSLKLERFYYRQNIYAFYVMQGIVFFLMLCMAVYSRVLIQDVFEALPFVKQMRKAVARSKI